MLLNRLFRMPSNIQKRKMYLKNRHQNQVSSGCGSDKIIPNCPLQGKKEITRIHGTLRRTGTYLKYFGRVGRNGSGKSLRI